MLDRVSVHAVLEGIGLAMWRGERPLFSDLDVAIRAGCALHVRGPNGCGKTTLLRILCGLLLPTHGELRAHGKTVQPAAYELRSLVSYLGHADGLKLELDVIENLQFARTLSGWPALKDPLNVLAQVGLAKVSERNVRELSAGQRRRLALARLIASEHRVWIMDEPFTALDRDGIALLSALIDEALGAGVAVVFTSHQAPPMGRGVEILDLA